MPADGGEHVEAPVGVHLDQAAPSQGRGELGRLGARDPGDVGEDVQAHGVLHHRQPPEAALLVVVEQLVGGAHRLVDRGRGGHVGDAHQRDLDPQVLDQQRQAAAGLEQPADGALVAAQVDRVASGTGDAGQEELHRGALERLAPLRDPQRPEPDDPLVGAAGHRRRGAQQPEGGGRLDELVAEQAEPVDAVDPVEDEQDVLVVKGTRERQGGRVAGCHVGAERVEARHDDGLGAAQVASRHPDGPRVRVRGVAGEQRLAAPGGARHGHPPAVVEEAADPVEGVLTPYAWSQHRSRLSTRIREYRWFHRCPAPCRPGTLDDSKPGPAGGRRGGAPPAGRAGPHRRIGGPAIRSRVWFGGATSGSSVCLRWPRVVSRRGRWTSATPGRRRPGPSCR